MTDPEHKELSVLIEELRANIQRASGELIDIQAGPNQEPRALSVRVGQDKRTHSPILLLDVFEQGQPIGHYDWIIMNDAPPLPEYANGNSNRRDDFAGTSTELQEQAMRAWAPSDGVEVAFSHRQQGLGSLLVASSVIALHTRRVPHLTIGAVSPLARNLWDSFDSQQCPVDNPFGGGMNPYAPVQDWVDIGKFMRLNAQKIQEVLAKTVKKA
jgi:hypothetical protein